MFPISLPTAAFVWGQWEINTVHLSLAYRCCAEKVRLRPGFVRKCVLVIPNQHFTWWEGMFLRHPIWKMHLKYAQSNILSALLAYITIQCKIQWSYHLDMIIVFQYIYNVLSLHNLHYCMKYFTGTCFWQGLFSYQSVWIRNQEVCLFMVAITTWSIMDPFRDTGGQSIGPAYA